jgi:hypothetical protein
VPDAPRTLRQCPQAAAERRAADTLVWTAARVEVPLPPQTPRAALVSTAVAGGACMDGRLPATAMSPPCSGGLRPYPRRISAGQDLAAIPTSSGHCRGVRCRGRPWVAGQVGAAGRHRRSKCATADAACGHPQPAGGRHGGHPRLRQGHADTAAWARGHRGSGRLDSRQRNRPLPLGCPAGNGTARSVDWCSTSDWSAPVGSGLLTLDASSIQTDPDGSRRIVWMINRMIKQGRQLDEPSRAGAQDLASAALSTRNGGESRSHLQRWTATLSA